MIEIIRSVEALINSLCDHKINSYHDYYTTNIISSNILDYLTIEMDTICNDVSGEFVIYFDVDSIQIAVENGINTDPSHDDFQVPDEILLDTISYGDPEFFNKITKHVNQYKHKFTIA